MIYLRTRQAVSLASLKVFGIEKSLQEFYYNSMQILNLNAAETYIKTKEICKTIGKILTARLLP